MESYQGQGAAVGFSRGAWRLLEELQRHGRKCRNQTYCPKHHDAAGEVDQRKLRQLVYIWRATYPRDDHGPLARALDGTPVAEPWHGFDARRRVESFLQKAFDAVH